MSFDLTWLQQRGYTLDGDRAVQSATATLDRPEAALLGQIRVLAQMTGWLVYHTYRSDKSAPGFPDLVLAKPGRLIFAEVKRRTGKLTADQARWLDVLRHTLPDLEVYTWRPADWQTIEATLAYGAQPCCT